MSGIQLVYDSRQDRILLRSGMEVAMPNWWFTRREVRKMLKTISTVTTAQYEAEKALEKIAQDNKSPAVDNKRKYNNNLLEKSYRDFHQSLSGDAKPSIVKSNTVEVAASDIPLSAQVKIELNDKQGIRLFVLSESQRGLCLEFSRQGLFRFNNMLFTVAQKAQWI